jgi:hypothetical protein
MNITSGITSLIANDGFRAQETRDGRWIYYSNMYAVLWRVPVGGGEAAQLPNALQPYSSATWTIVGNDLLVLRKSSSLQNTFDLWKANSRLETSRMGEIVSSPESDVLSINASPNGRVLLVDTRDEMTSDIVIRRSANE